MAQRYGPPAGEEEMVQLSALIAWAFAADQQRYAQWLARLGLERQRVLRDGGAVAAGLVNYPMGQFFGGRCVPVWGVGCVAVPPERRGQGLGRQLMTANLREMHAAGVPLSPLYPATQTLYRRLGWELAGTRLVYELDLPALAKMPAAGGWLRRAQSPEDEDIRRLYRTAAQHTDGHLDRCATIWERLQYPPEELPVMGCVAHEDSGRPAGYLLYIQKRDSVMAQKHLVDVKDLVFDSPDAGRQLLGLLTHHRSVADKAQLAAGPADPLLLLTGERVCEPLERNDWMLRIVDVKAALESRGWPSAISAEVSLRIRDEVLPQNDGCFTLRVAGGAAAVRPARSAATALDIRGLAALYSGWLSPYQLRQAGYLRGATGSDPLLRSLFGGAPAWMPDFF